ncbi:MAG: triose-phosphate isomerase [Hydrotalea sp.]|nr:triose-phosphate isomerase [Hydrotalea sp.]
MGKLIIANWKMNLPVGSMAGITSFAEKFSPAQKKLLVVAPPYPFLTHVRATGFHTAAQDVSSNEKGAFTGDVSAELLMQAGVNYCIVGHSERRQNHNEGHELLAQKIIQLLNHHITPVFCVGEHADEHASKKTNDVLSAQLHALDNFKDKEIIIAYEPVWAIGTGLNAGPDHIKTVHHYIKQRLGNDTHVLYGGSVNAGNAAAILALREVDGLLIGGASLKPDEMVKILAMV